MPALTAADREYLSVDWRWLEANDPMIKTRHPGAREAEIGTPFMASPGAQAVLNIISAWSTVDRKLVVLTCDGVLPVSFKGRPSTVGFFSRRFGGDPTVGKLYLVERADIDHGLKRTTLYLSG